MYRQSFDANINDATVNNQRKIIMKPFMRLVTLTSLFIALILIYGCNRQSLDSAETNQGKLVNLYVGPIESFADSCAECHGENGSDFEESFKEIKDANLVAKIRNMMQGPAKLVASSDHEINAMFAYHQALRDDKIFLIVNNAASITGGKDTKLNGNVTPDASITLTKEQISLQADVTGFEWEIDNPPNPPFTLTATRNGQEISFDFPDRQWNELSE